MSREMETKEMIKKELTTGETVNGKAKVDTIEVGTIRFEMDYIAYESKKTPEEEKKADEERKRASTASDLAADSLGVLGPAGEGIDRIASGRALSISTEDFSESDATPKR